MASGAIATGDAVPSIQAKNSKRRRRHTASGRTLMVVNCHEPWICPFDVPGNRHRASPVKHSVTGVLSDNPTELGRHARMLLEDKNLIELRGRQAGKTVSSDFR